MRNEIVVPADRDALEKMLPSCVKEFVWFDVTGSTNTEARLLAEKGAPSGTLVAAGCQSKGRGRLGRSFFSPEGTGIYFSLLLRPQLSSEKLPAVTPAAAVAAALAVEEVSGRNAGIKWVNDIFVGGRKVCGILAESSHLSGAAVPEYTVCGIGVNVFEPDGGFPDEIKNVAGAVFGKDEPRPALARERICARAAELICELAERPYVRDIYNEYVSRCFLIGKVIRTPSRRFDTALCLGVDRDYRLLVLYPDGSEEALFSGEVSLGSAENGPAGMRPQG